MASAIQAIFITPGLAFARLGSSTIPQDAYDWVDSTAPRTDGETTLSPSWTLEVQSDGSARPFMPTTVVLRDGDRIRPVAPFFEIWARVGTPGSDAGMWTEVPLTPSLLRANGTALAALRLTVTARNLKAARRTGNPQLAFGNWQPLVILGNDHTRKVIEGKSPPNVTVPMIPQTRSIPMGSVQMLRSKPQPEAPTWPKDIDTDVIRFRFTPAAGEFYGPPEAAVAQPTLGRPEPAVPSANAFLDPTAGWRGTPTRDVLEPADTYDVIDQDDSTGPSLGVVDDTCEVRFEVSLRLADGSTTLRARSTAFVGPPDFAPDRRPFLSIADEINDRDADATQRNAMLTGDALDHWVEDLFERIYETMSLLNVDRYRDGRAAVNLGGNPAQREDLPPGKLQPVDLDLGARDAPGRAMGGRDALRNPLYRLAAPSNNDPLPLSQHARMRHRALSDLQNLVALVAQDAQAPNRNRLRDIVRAPFEVERFENALGSSMRMPPFMRQSNALPLTLAAWQYELLMHWVSLTLARTSGMAAPGIAAAAVRKPMSPGAAARRMAVLARIEAAEHGP